MKVFVHVEQSPLIYRVIYMVVHIKWNFRTQALHRYLLSYVFKNDYY